MKVTLRESFVIESGWWPLPDLNWGPTDYESAALTTELRGHFRKVVNPVGLTKRAQVYAILPRLS